MFSSIAAAPASCIARGVVGPAAGRDAVEAADHRNVDGGRGALEQAQVAARAGSSSAAAGKYDSDSAKLSVPASASRAFSSASRRSCSSNSE